MHSANHFDFIIIGTGAGGGTLAHRLAPSGKKILLIERGDYVPREKANWDPAQVNVAGRYQTTERWFDSEGEPMHPHTNYYVGGNTKFYGAALFRLRREDFNELQHEDGVSPSWPISYEEIEPYYAEAERLYEVHGQRGEDPTEPFAAEQYPYPPISHEKRIQELSDDLSAQGLHPFHTPLGVRLNEADSDASKCIRCNTCDGFPCLLHAKSDAHILCVEPALRHPNVTLIRNALVQSLTTSDSGREITGVNVMMDGEVHVFLAEIVVSACGAINSAALLLRSANDQHPNGLANSSGVVGRHYMGHNNSVLMAVSRCPNPTVFQKTMSLNDFYLGSNNWPFPMGHISFVGKLDGVTLQAGAPAIAPGWTLDLMAKHSLDFWLTSEDLPDPRNRVTLNRDGDIVLSYTPNNLRAHQQLKVHLENALKNIHCTTHETCHQGLFARNLFLGQQIPLAGVAHQNGTIRFGTDPSTSALDIHCKAHDVDNLYVVDASFFPSSAAVNPGLTIIANALRVGDHLLERVGARSALIADGSLPVFSRA